MMSSKSILLLVLAVVSSVVSSKTQQQQQQEVGKSTNKHLEASPTSSSQLLSARKWASTSQKNGLEQQFEWEDTFRKKRREDDGAHRRALQQEGHRETEEEEHDHEDEHEDEEHHEEEEVSASKLKKKPWAEVIITSILINMATLAGLVVTLFSMLGKALLGNKIKAEGGPPPFAWKVTHNIIPSFACGALLATTVFLILPEAFHTIEAGVNVKLGVEEEEEHHEDHRQLLARFLQDIVNSTLSNMTDSSNTTATMEEDEEHEEHVETEVPIAWRLGVSVMGGFLIPVVTSLFFPHYDDDAESTKESEAPPKKELSDEEDETTSPAGETEEPVKPVVPQAPKAINYALMSSILLGDFFHNFTDGILVGVSFSLCTRSLAISVAAATLYHELAQEVGDYFMLTKHCHLTPMVALICNFCGGLSVLLGGFLILLLDISDLAVGCILAMGGGVYLYIGAAECLPRARLAQTSPIDTLIGLGAFCMGAVPIGLVLLNHEHCADHH
jgi:zinc transporter ZupT